MANHEGFTDHLLRDWELSGPDRGVGSKARVHVTARSGVSDVVDIEVVDAEAPSRIVERNVAAKAGAHRQRHLHAVELPGGGTRVQFEYSWQEIPLSERVMSPVVAARRAAPTSGRWNGRW